MFKWLRQLATRSPAGNGQRGRLFVVRGKPWTDRWSVKAKYDAAQTTYENRRHWANADQLSANAASSAEVRRVLRSRARYEVANNSYAKGIVLTLANYVIGTGPRLQMLTDDPNAPPRGALAAGGIGATGCSIRRKNWRRIAIQHDLIPRALMRGLDSLEPPVASSLTGWTEFRQRNNPRVWG